MKKAAKRGTPPARKIIVKSSVVAPKSSVPSGKSAVVTTVGGTVNKKNTHTCFFKFTHLGLIVVWGWSGEWEKECRTINMGPYETGEDRSFCHVWGKYSWPCWQGWRLSVLRSQSHQTLQSPPPIDVMSPPHSTRFLVMSPDPYNIFPHLFPLHRWRGVERGRIENSEDSLRFNKSVPSCNLISDSHLV